MSGDYYTILPLSTQLQFNHLIASTPTANDRHDYRHAVFAVSIVLISCTVISVGIRLIRSWQAQRHFELHDTFIVLAAVCAVVMSSECAYLSGRGLGMHDYNDRIAQDAHFQRSVLATNVFYFTCNFFVKLALLNMYRKFTRETWGMALIYLMEIGSFFFWIGSVLATVLECMPLRAIWDWSIREGWCINLSYFYVANASIMIGMDVVLYMMPVIFTWRLHLSRPKKIGLNILFGLGCIVLTASVVRLWIVHQAITEGDMSYNYGRCLLVSSVENHVAIVIACAPAMRSLCMQGIFQVKDVLSSGRGRIGKLLSSSSSSAPSTPCSDKFHKSTPAQSASWKIPKANQISMLGSIFSNRSQAVTQASSRGDDLELGLQDTTCEYMPSISTSITAGGAPPRPPSSKNKLYVTQEMSVTEENLEAASAGHQSSTCDSESNRSFALTETTCVSSDELAALPMPSPNPIEAEFTDADGIMRKDFAEKLKAHT